MNANRTQRDYWTSPAGLKWIEHRHALDAAMAGMLARMLDAATMNETDQVLDVGCGTGAGTLKAAQRCKLGKALGVDISEPLLARAENGAREEGIGNAKFLLADARTHRFPRGGFDVLISRIGMSFFSDSLAAVENLKNALRDAGRMSFVCWAAAKRNPWFYIPKRVAEAQLGPLPAGDPRAPGPTAFEDIDYVTGMMSRAGLARIGAEQIEIFLTQTDGARGAARAASNVGPAARVMKAHNGKPADAEAIKEAVRREFAQFEHDGDAQVPALVNLFTCSA